MPLASELVKRLGEDNFRYVATEGEHTERTKLGWLMGELPTWVLCPARSEEEKDEAKRWCNSATILLSGLREFELYRERAERGLQTFYFSERWLKPPVSFLRLLHPGYFRMARRFFSLLRNGAVVYLPMGIHAAEDMVRISDFLNGKLSRLFRQLRLQVSEHEPFASFDRAGSFVTLEYSSALDNMRLWGYFVEPSAQAGKNRVGEERQLLSQKDAHINAGVCQSGQGTSLRLLWLGRMLDWKRVDTLIVAVVRLLDEGMDIRLEVVGYGPEEEALRRLSGRYLIADHGHSEAGMDSAEESFVAGDRVPGIVFVKPVPIKQVRDLMRAADVVVLSSDGGEGWGAVVNEAMAEGCCVIGTHEAGSSATMIEHGHNGWLYQAGNVTELADLLRHCDRAVMRECGECAQETLETLWSPTQAADRLLEFARQRMQPSGSAMVRER